MIGVILQEYFFDSYLFESSFDCTYAHHLPCFFFLLGAPMLAGSTNGPDQVWIFAFGCEKFVELNGTSGGSYDGSMCCEEPKG